MCPTGRFDLFGHSHNWWHALTLFCFVWYVHGRVLSSMMYRRARWFYAGLHLWEFRRTTPCAI